MRLFVLALIAALAAALAMGPAAGMAKSKPKKRPKTQSVMYVGNNWDGTADVINPTKFKRIARLNIVPDKAERLAEIQANPDRQAYFLGIRQLVGEGHDQFVDDMFSSHDGRLLYISRPSLADVIALNLRTGRIKWRVPVDGYRADHMGISPDGKRLLVSASTEKVIDVIDTKAGKIVARIPSGDQPHESNFSRDGKLIYHASIGTVFTPLDDPIFDASKGERVFEIIDAKTYKVLKTIDMGQKLDESGEPDMSGAVRPMALAPDEKFVYFQVSFFHGFVEYDLRADKVTRLARLPLSQEAAKLRREEYLLDSAHHGLSMNPRGTKLCAAGTMSDYTAIVHRDDFSYRIINSGKKPYWSTNSGDGKYCFVSASGDDKVAVISYSKEKQVATIPVGDHPQRMRMGKLRRGLLEQSVKQVSHVPDTGYAQVRSGSGGLPEAKTPTPRPQGDSVKIRLVAAAVMVVLAGTLAIASTASAAPTWAPAATAAIHPGVQTVTDGGQCTANFIYTDGTNVFIGQAAHCSGTDGNTATDGCSSGSLPVGTKVDVDGASQQGTMVYNSWIAMQQQGETDPDTCQYNDLALVQLAPADAAKVNPSVPYWGGPTGLGGATAEGDDVFSYGNSSLRGGVTTLSPKKGLSLGTDSGGWNHTVYTVTPGIPGDSGSGFLDNTGKAFGVLSTVAIAPLAGSNGVGDLAQELAYMHGHSSFSGVNLANGTEAFDGSKQVVGG